MRELPVRVSGVEPPTHWARVQRQHTGPDPPAVHSSHSSAAGKLSASTDKFFLCDIVCRALHISLSESERSRELRSVTNQPSSERLTDQAWAMRRIGSGSRDGYVGGALLANEEGDGWTAARLAQH